MIRKTQTFVPGSGRGNAKRETQNDLFPTFSVLRSTFNGFTLIELLVVISIIGILIALSAVAFQSTKASARDAKRKADLEEIRSALEIYRTDCGRYPTTLSFSNALAGDGSSSSCSTTNVYMAKVPNDPQTSAYQYSYVQSGSGYKLCSYLETVTSCVADDGSCSDCSTCGPSGCRYKVKNP